MRSHRKHKRKPRWRASQRQLSQLTEREVEQLRRPEIPFKQWRNGEALLGSKIERLTIARHGRENGKALPDILASKAALRRLIGQNPKLACDFEFFTRNMEWPAEGFLNLLYHHCNMMGITLQGLIAREKKQRGPMDRKAIKQIIKGMEALSSHEYFPDHLRRIAEQVLDLPLYLADRGWPRRKAALEYVFESTRQASLYEQIRAKCGQYHSTRLHRLINAARCAQGLQPIEQRAFIKWLNGFKKARERAKTVMGTRERNA